MICSGSIAEDQFMVAHVIKNGEKKAIIEVKNQTQYIAEGDLVDRRYKISKGQNQVAQVLPIQIPCTPDKLQPKRALTHDLT